MGIERQNKIMIKLMKPVDIYQTIEVEKLMTIADYAKSQIKQKTIEKQLGSAKLIRNF